MLAQLREVTKRYVRTEGVRDLTLDIDDCQVMGVLDLNGSWSSWANSAASDMSPRGCGGQDPDDWAQAESSKIKRIKLVSKRRLNTLFRFA